LLLLVIPFSILMLIACVLLILLLLFAAVGYTFPPPHSFPFLRLARYVNHMLNFGMNLVKHPGAPPHYLPTAIEDRLPIS
jgi:hypothetical protein